MKSLTHKEKREKVIIVGGGTAGLVIANNLQGNFNVVVVEKSQYKKYPIWYKVPLLIGLLFKNNKTKYVSKREHILSNGRRIPFFESNLFGGTSVINGCVHMLGSKVRWTSILEKFNSNYNDLLKNYNELYSLNLRDKRRMILSVAPQNIIDRSFVSALGSRGVAFKDMNFSDKEGCGPVLNTVKKYFRTSVLSLIDKCFIEQYINESAQQLLFNDNGKVVGVKTSSRDIFSDYVILSGGVVGTCNFLLKEKERMGKKNDFLAGVNPGKDIKDHTNLRINVLTNKGINSLNEISDSLLRKFMLVFKHFSGRKTLMRGTGATTAAHLDLDGDGLIDTRIQIVQFSETGRIGSDGSLFSSNEPGFSISITAIHPKSKGTIELSEGGVVINPMYLSVQKDIELLKLALIFCVDLLKSKQLSCHILKIEKEEEIINNPTKYIMSNVFSGYHLIGGSQDLINSDFSVKSTKGLYVCDASIFDSYAASNIHSSVVLIASIFSKKFLTLTT